MLEQLVESRESYGDGKRRGGFLLMTMVLIVSLFGSGLVWSLFAKDFGIGDESLELSTLVAPVIPAQEEPPTPEPIERELQPEQSSNARNELPSRRENILRLDESPIDPKVVSVNPNANKERPKGSFNVIPGVESNGSFSGSTGRNSGRGCCGNDSAGEGNKINSQPIEIDEKDPPPPLKTPTPVPPVKKPPTQHIGVVNGKALDLPKPAYPRPAQQLRLSGDVSVQVTIDENGKVISAKAVNGHPFFKQVSESAARSATFRPTILNGQPVKVTGVIIYKFSTQ